MLSPMWRRKEVTDMKFMGVHFELKDGLAKIENWLLNTQRVTIARSGIPNLNRFFQIGTNFFKVGELKIAQSNTQYSGIFPKIW